MRRLLVILLPHAAAFSKYSTFQGSKGQGSSKKIINLDKQEVALDKPNARVTCPKDTLKFTFFSSPD